MNREVMLCKSVRMSVHYINKVIQLDGIKLARMHWGPVPNAYTPCLSTQVRCYSVYVSSNPGTCWGCTPPTLVNPIPPTNTGTSGSGGTAANYIAGPSTPMSNLTAIDAPEDPAVDYGIINTTEYIPSIPERRVGGSAPRPGGESTEDLEYGTSASTAFISPQDLLKYDDNTLFNYMTDLFKKTTVFDVQNYALGVDFIARFRNRAGGIYSNSILNDKVEKTNVYKSLIQDFGKSLSGILSQTNGVLNPILDLTVSRPQFSTPYHKVHGLQILINDTEKADIFINGFNINPNVRFFYATGRVEILDHFGLDRNDASSYQGYHWGFPSWYLLQHTRNYVPFKTKISINFSIAGKY